MIGGAHHYKNVVEVLVTAKPLLVAPHRSPLTPSCSTAESIAPRHGLCPGFKAPLGETIDLLTPSVNEWLMTLVMTLGIGMSVYYLSNVHELRDANEKQT